MALTAQIPASSTLYTSSNSQPYVTSSFTPTADSLMVIFCCSRGASTNTHTVTGSTTGTIDKKVSEFGTASNQTSTMHVVKVGASPSATTISLGVTGSQTGGIIIPVCWTGYDSSLTALNAIVQTDTVVGSAASGSDTLPSGTPGNTGNRCGSFWISGGTAGTMVERNSGGAGAWTELSEGSFASPTTASHAQWRSDAFEQTYSASWTGSSAFSGIGYEVAVATAAAVVKHLAILGVG